MIHGIAPATQTDGCGTTTTEEATTTTEEATTTTEEATTTTEEATTTTEEATTTTEKATTTTEKATTTTQKATTTDAATTQPAVTTGDTGGEGNNAPPVNGQGSGAGLPSTGSNTSTLVVLGLFLTIGGLAMSTMTRRRSTTR